MIMKATIYALAGTALLELALQARVEYSKTHWSAEFKREAVGRCMSAFPNEEACSCVINLLEKQGIPSMYSRLTSSQEEFDAVFKERVWKFTKSREGNAMIQACIPKVGG